MGNQYTNLVIADSMVFIEFIVQPITLITVTPRNIHALAVVLLAKYTCINIANPLFTFWAAMIAPLWKLNMHAYFDSYRIIGVDAHVWIKKEWRIRGRKRGHRPRDG
ncbi:hypothetical protein K0U00_10975, partial [Paenibacillus sepulcri]|nr:hypothetical protein [Paenibacillus sepulcri]